MLRILTLAVLSLGLAWMPGACGTQEPAQPAATTSADADAAEDIEQMSAYTTQLETWFRDFYTNFEEEADEAFAFDDPLAPTESELLRARQVTDLMRESVSELLALSAPPRVAEAHAQLCSALRTYFAGLERYVNALDWGSDRDIELAMREAEKSSRLFAQALNGLEPYVDLSSMIHQN